LKIGSLAMPKRKEVEKFAEQTEKDCWHAYSLQMLTPSRFTAVVGKILKGNYSLLNTKFEKGVPARFY